MTEAPIRRGGGMVLAIGLVWLGLAVALGASGRLLALRPPVPQLVVLGLTVAVVLAGAYVPTLRAWAWTVDLRVLVALHLTRMVGAWFLVLYRRGELPYAFAVPGGWGDMAVALGALILLIGGPPTRGSGWRQGYVAWNVFGLLDILLVVATATRLALADPPSMRALLHLPLSLLPTLLVPVIIASHVLIALRLSSDRTRFQPREAT